MAELGWRPEGTKEGVGWAAWDFDGDLLWNMDKKSQQGLQALRSMCSSPER